MKISDEAFEEVEELSKQKGPGLADLLTRRNIATIGLMSRRYPERWVAMQARLHSWVSIAQLRASVKTFTTQADEAKKRADAEDNVKGKLDEAVSAGRPWIAAGEPVTIAKDFARLSAPGLLFVGEDFMEYERGRYALRPKKELRSRVQEWMDSGVDAQTGDDYAPSRRELDDVMDGLTNYIYRNPERLTPPSWIDPAGFEPNPKSVISLGNGLLDVDTGILSPHTPAFFTRVGLEHHYIDPAFCDAPRMWLRFLDQIFPGAKGPDEIRHLQEVMGYMLTADTKYEKIFLFVGARRSGKGTIVKVLTALIGDGNVAPIKVDQLGKDFGLAQLVNKQLMVDAEVRIGLHADRNAIAQRLLGISGRDRQSVGIKFKDDWTGRLDVKTLLVGNMEMVISDHSGALNGRYVPSVFTESFFGRENTKLFERDLVPELPQIMNWCLEGRNRLEARGHFEIPKMGVAMLRDIARKASPVKSFIDECCIADFGQVGKRKDIFEAFEGWTREMGVKPWKTLDHFTTELISVNRNISLVLQPRTDGKRIFIYDGVALRPEFVGYKWPNEFEDEEDEED